MESEARYTKSFPVLASTDAPGKGDLSKISIAGDQGNWDLNSLNCAWSELGTRSIGLE